MKILSFFLSGSLLFGCKGAVNSKDDLFELRIENVSVQPGRPGDGSWLRPSSYEGVYELIVLGDKTTQYVSAEAAQQILKMIQKNGTMKMKNDYSSLDILDGSRTRVTISIGRKTKEIRLRNALPLPLKELFQSMNSLMALPTTVQWCQQIRLQCRVLPEWQTESVRLKIYLEKHIQQPIDSIILNAALDNVFDQAENKIDDSIKDIKILREEFIALNPFSSILLLDPAANVTHFSIGEDQQRAAMIFVRQKLSRID